MVSPMRLYLINLARRPDRLAAMLGQAAHLERVEALDAAQAEPETLNRWFEDGGPLGEIPAGDKACLLSHRRAWELFVAGPDSHAVFLEDDVRLSKSASALLAASNWIPSDAAVVKLEHYGPPGQRVLLTDMRTGPPDFQRWAACCRVTPAPPLTSCRGRRPNCCCARRVSICRWIICCSIPTIRGCSTQLNPWQLLPAIARQQEFVGEKSDIESTRVKLRSFGLTYAWRELVRSLAMTSKLVPRQVACAAGCKRSS